MLKHSAARVLACLVLILVAMPQATFAVSVMDPFNIPGTLDSGVVELGKDIPYGAAPRLKLDVYAPQNPKGAAPVVVFLYGGGWDRGAKGDYVFAGHAFASKGFVTVIPDYRLVPKVRFPTFVEDSAAAVKWVEDNISKFGGDPYRIFVVDHSAGAYNAVMLGLDGSYLRQAGARIPVRGVAGLSGPYDFYPFQYAEVINAFGHADNPRGTQPVDLVSADAPPMFLATGTMDPIVKPINTKTLATKLAAAGATVTMKRYDGLEHMQTVLALGPAMRWRAPVLDDIVKFFTGLGAFDPKAIGAVQLVH